MTKTEITIFLIDEKATIELGKTIAKNTPNNCTIYLSGELGVGKTTLVRGFLRALGYKKTVKSPTYTLVEPYELHHKKIYHFDLYRLTDPKELDFIGARDYFGDGVCLVEWAEKGKNYLPKADIECYFAPKNEGRLIKIMANTKCGEELLIRVHRGLKIGL